MSNVENHLKNADSFNFRDSEPVSLRRGGSSYSSYSGSSSSSKGGGSIALFFVGLIFIGLALPMVWYNERTQVHMFNLIKRGRKEVITVPAHGLYESNNFKLVHVNGHTSTETSCDDQPFGLSLSNSMKLVRHVEMF